MQKGTCNSSIFAVEAPFDFSDCLIKRGWRLGERKTSVATRQLDIPVLGLELRVEIAEKLP
jgi:hypothetical protein